MRTTNFVEAMKARLVPGLPAGNWVYEVKVDGYRALAFKVGKEVRLMSRNRIDFSDNYPQVVDSLKLLPAKDAIIDGEVAALDPQGRSSFQLLQSYGIRKQIPLVYYTFDLLSLEGRDLRFSTADRTTQTAGQAAQESPGQYEIFRRTRVGS